MRDYKAIEAQLEKYTKKVVKRTLETVNEVIDLNTKRNGLVDAEELKQGLVKVFRGTLEGEE